MTGQTFGDDIPVPTEDDEQDTYISEEAVFEDLKIEMKEEPDEEPEWWAVPNRPDIELNFRCYVEYDSLSLWQRTCTNRKKNTFDGLRFATLILTHTTRGIRSKGRDVMWEGNTTTLVSEKWWRDTCGASNPAQALRTLFKSDGHLMAMAGKVLEEAGYGDVDIESGESPLGLG